MREKTDCFVVTFPTTTAALAWEDVAKEKGISGRLVPIPQEITAGCGLAWKMPISEKETVQTLLQTLVYDGMYEMWL